MPYSWACPRMVTSQVRFLSGGRCTVRAFSSMKGFIMSYTVDEFVNAPLSEGEVLMFELVPFLRENGLSDLTPSEIDRLRVLIRKSPSGKFYVNLHSPDFWADVSEILCPAA